MREKRFLLTNGIGYAILVVRVWGNTLITTLLTTRFPVSMESLVMVQVNKLGGAKKPVAGTPRPAPEKEKQSISDNEVGTMPTNLIQSNNATLANIAKGVAIPAFLQNQTMPDTAERDFSGYTGFASSQSPKYPQMQLAGLKDGQPFAYIDKNYIPLDNLNFFLCAGESFQTCISGREGNMLFATRDMEMKGPQFGTNRTEPHYVILMILDINGTLTPIKGDFKGTKAGGCEGAISAVKAASDPDWLRLSDAHKTTAAFPQPFGRVYHSITTKYEVSKTSGNPYYRTMCVSAPATVSHMQRLVESLQDADFNIKLEEAYENYGQRLKFLDEAVKKFAKPTA